MKPTTADPRSRTAAPARPGGLTEPPDAGPMVGTAGAANLFVQMISDAPAPLQIAKKGSFDITE